MKVWAKVSSAVAFSRPSSANRGEFRFRRLIVSEGGNEVSVDINPPPLTSTPTSFSPCVS